MFGQLPELFGRNFFMGYFLPACLTLGAVIGLLDVRHYTSIYHAIGLYIASKGEKVPFGAAAVALASAWAWAVLLLGINYPLTRALEGYGRGNPANLWKWRSIRVFRRLTAAVQANAVQANKENSDPKIGYEIQSLAALFPEEEGLVLATRFGNIMRAAERYPQVLYSIDAMQMWPRLWATMPDSQRDAVATARAALDFWVNLWFGAFVIASTEATLALIARDWHAPFVLVALGVAIVMAKLAQASALEFGLLVKSSFDLYRENLSKQLGLILPDDADKEREMWKLVSQAMLYREPRALNDAQPYRIKRH